MRILFPFGGTVSGTGFHAVFHCHLKMEGISLFENLTHIFHGEPRCCSDFVILAYDICVQRFDFLSHIVFWATRQCQLFDFDRPLRENGEIQYYRIFTGMVRHIVEELFD